MVATKHRMGRVPALTGKPTTQATKNAMGTGGKSMPVRSRGKPGKSLTGSPMSVSDGTETRQPKGKAPSSLKQGNYDLKLKTKAVANVRGGSGGRRG